MSYPIYIVACRDLDDNYTMATHRPFKTEEAAYRYVVTLAPSREAIVVSVHKPFHLEFFEAPSTEAKATKGEANG